MQPPRPAQSPQLVDCFRIAVQQSRLSGPPTPYLTLGGLGSACHWSQTFRPDRRDCLPSARCGHCSSRDQQLGALALDLHRVQRYPPTVLATRTAPAIARLFWTVVLAFTIGLRLLSPEGFMPAFDRGAVVIAACPDVGLEITKGSATHHHDSKTKQQPCPYASASPSGALAAGASFLFASAAISLPLLLGRTFAFLERHRAGERPPTRGPPTARLI